MLVGNILCVVVESLENFLFMGMFISWGQITTIFKSKDMYLDYCETEIETCGSVNIINCDARNVLFNNIYTTSNILMSLCNLFIGILSDKIGLFVPRLITTALFAAGLTLMTFVEENESLIWIAWPLIAMGGLAGHVINLKSCFATPTIKATLMQVLSGAFGTAGSVGWVITLMIDNLGLEFKTVWFIWLTSYLVFAAIKIVFWTPNQIPMVETNDEFSLVENSVLLKCFSCSKTTAQKTEESKKPEISYLKMVFGDCKLTFNYVLVLLGYIAIVVRRQAYTSWFGSGWPEWVAQETDPALFNEQINEFQSILALAFFPVNILPGLMIDLLTSKFGRLKGTGIGIGVSFLIGAVFMFISSIMHAQQNELVAYISILLHNFGRVFAVVWTPTYYYVFPPAVFGFIFGSISLATQPFALMNIAMLNFCLENKEYATMNYVLAGLSMLLVCVSLACYLRYKQVRASNKVTSDELYKVQDSEDCPTDNSEF